MNRCLKCGRETQVEGQICSECARKLEDELSRRGVTKHEVTTPADTQKPVENKDRLRLKNKIVTWLLVVIFLGIIIGLLIYFYLGVLDRT